MQRTGRKDAAQFRVVVQDSRRTPTSGNIVALLGHYDPHTKTTVINKEKAEFYLSNGAQPSDRVVRIFQYEKINIPSWVKLPVNKTASVKNKDKLRKNRPVEEVVEVVEEVAVVEPVVEAEAVEVIEETPVVEPEVPAEESSTEEAAPVEESKEEVVAEEKVEAPAEDKETTEAKKE
jgi:small subunit ribosomal protein S16